MERARTLAHVSDLHFGRSHEQDRACGEIARALLAADIDAVVLTGDVTHRGRASELECFHEAWAPLLQSGRVALVPGNHDRLGDDIAASVMGPGGPVQTLALPGIHLIRVDSTGAHNRSWRTSHGVISQQVLERIDCALAEAAPGALRVVALHHHPLPLPDDTVVERLLGAMRICTFEELEGGAELVRRIVGACDLVLHGHRHRPAAVRLGVFGAPYLGIYNAGSSSELGMVRLFEHRGGRLVREPRWLRIADVMAAEPGAEREPAVAAVPASARAYGTRLTCPV